MTSENLQQILFFYMTERNNKNIAYTGQPDFILSRYKCSIF